MKEVHIILLRIKERRTGLNQVLRVEKKFLITLEQSKGLSDKISQILEQDRHNGTNGYRIRSLYFDTLGDRDYFDKEEGLEIRRKIRLRCYGSKDAYAKLEMKQKQGEMQKKRSLLLSRKEAESICRGDYQVLLQRSEEFAAECYGIMNCRLYRPKGIVEYNRMAFIGKENDTRITFDSNIRGTESNYNIFEKNLCLYPVFEPSWVVLEVKYNGFLLSYIKGLLDSVGCREISISKYSRGRGITCSNWV